MSNDFDLPGSLYQRVCLCIAAVPAYRAGTDKIAELRRKHPAAQVLPVLYGCNGLVDIETIDPLLTR